MDLNIIYDNRHSEDYGRLLGEFMVQDIYDFKFWDAVILKDSVVKSINASHKKIVQWAKDNNKKEVCIGEQDLTFPAKDGWKYFLKNKPDDYDIYLGCSYVPNDIICGFHLYVINESFYNKFLSIPDHEHIDTAANDLGGKYVFCKPYPALQRAGFSANNMTDVNYNSVLKEEDIYKG